MCWGYQKPAKVDQTESAERAAGIIYARGICVSTAVRPGILVLINDADWELMYLEVTFKASLFFFLGLQGELDYKLQDQDNVLFISTLHGG
ncbi:hypothetical protein CIB84_011674 [Bambusicola thoracicus]|uniref:Ubiquitin-related modifier 1 n=1 Tax=Bambusicola thoracicus TaxID=9083 RepID=A0A2P4SKE8_BAMTH|nr:hypothetical protein CIB84_011674 [Bambusicola thoracicus]